MAEKKVIEIEIQDNTKSLKAQYREAVQEVQKLVQAYGETSEQVAEAAKRAAELKDQIEDTNDAIAAFKGEGVFNATGKAVSSVASGFSAVEGAVALVGVESEALQETMVKLQAAMALSQGLQGLEDAGRAFGTLKTVAVNAFNGMSTATKVFMATGLGLLIAGLGTVIAYWDDISEAVGFTNKEQENYIKQQKQIAENSKKQAEFVAKESIEFVSLATQLKNTNQGSKERSKLIKDINNQYGTTLKNLSDEAEFQAQVNNTIAEYIEYQKAKYALQINDDLMRRNMEKQFKIQADIARQEEKIAKAKRLEAVDDRIRELSSISRKKITIKQDAEIRDLQRERQKLHNENVATVETENFTLQFLNEELKNAKDRFDKYAGSVGKASDKINALTYNGKRFVENVKDTKKEIEKIGLTNEQLDELLAESLKKLSEPIVLPTPEFTDEPIDLSIVEEATHEINNYWAELELGALKSFEGYKTLLHARMEEELRVTRATGAEAEAIRKKYGDLEIARQNEINKTKLQMAADAFGAIAGLIESFNAKDEATARKQFKVAKAFNLASALTNTFLAVTGALTAGGNPIKLATGQQIAEAAIVGTMGLANVAKIASTQFNSSGGSIGGGGSSMSSGGGIVAPNLNVVGDTGINQLAQLGQTPIKAYVVSNDITTAQMFDLKVQQTASL